MRTLIGICSVWLIVGSAAVMGQDQDADDSQPIVLDEAEIIPELVFDEQAEVDEDDESGEETPETPGRFIPSEQISQDLGVSFPANI